MPAALRLLLESPGADRASARAFHRLWERVLREAAELGVLQADFTGGEPLARPDLIGIIRAARDAGLYASLITSGLPLDEKRLDELVAAGLDHFQLSFQGAEEEAAREFSGTQHARPKLRVADG